MSGSDANSTSPRQLWLVPTEGQVGHQLVADVAVARPTGRLHTYGVPEALAERVRPGAAVRVPYGRKDRLVEGICVRVSAQPWDHTRRPIVDATPSVPWLTPALADLGLWVADYYACPPWKTFRALAPQGVRGPRLRRVAYVRATGRELPRRPTAKQLTVLAALAAGELRRDELLQRSAASAAVLRGLIKGRVVELLVRREPVDEPAIAGPPVAVPSPEDEYELTAGQRAAVERLGGVVGPASAFRVFLLFGVPASGKTEVYVRAIRQAVAHGRQAVLLIPEIALATQLVDRLARRFGRVAVLHSQLPAGQRRDTLAAVAAGGVDVVIGTRTAVFAPCPRLGLIVVDEEQEGSFKNLAAPFYHARDVAIKRAQLEGVPVVLGSATPALETWFNAQHRPQYECLRLPARIPGTYPPSVRLVETGRAVKAEFAEALGPALRAELERTLAAGQQAILLHNRRGYALFMRCARCGLMLRCPRCETHLVYHRAGDVLKCHRCGRESERPPRCVDDACGGELQQSGLAIQRLEEELRAAFPAARLLRLDRDTMRRRADYAQALVEFEAGGADILLGTQMVAKGLDFPRVRLVGVIAADAALSLPDFRAGERVFQLIVQVVGRAGRRPGESLAIVQAGERPPATVRHALRLDYESFAAEELELRQRYFYPPAARLARFVLADARPGRAAARAERLAEELRRRAAQIHAGLRVDPAEPCAAGRLRELARYQVLVRGPDGARLQELLRAASDERLLTPGVQRLTIDVDPIDLL